MPDFAVASSNRIEDAEGAYGAACACRIEESMNDKTNEKRIFDPRLLKIGICVFKLMFSCRTANRAGHVSGSCRVQQSHRNSIFRRSLRPSVATYAHALFPATHPEPARFPLQGLAGSVQQFRLQRLFGGDLYKEGPVTLHLRCS